MREPLLNLEAVPRVRIWFAAEALLAVFYCFANFCLRFLSRVWIVFEPTWMKFCWIGYYRACWSEVEGLDEKACLLCDLFD